MYTRPAIKIIESNSGSEGLGRQSISELSISESSTHNDEIPVEDGELLKDILNDIAHIITSLYNLSVAIQNPVPQERLAKFAAINVSHFKPWDIEQIRGKFPEAPEYLIERMGEANCRRRQFLVYYKNHYDKIARNINLPLTSDGLWESTSNQDHSAQTGDGGCVIMEGAGPIFNLASAPTSTLPQSQATATKIMADAIASHEIPTSDGDTDEDEDDLGDDEDHLSHTSYASSKNHRIFVDIPPPPNSGDAFNGQPLLCPYCFQMIKLGSRLSWRSVIYPFYSSESLIQKLIYPVQKTCPHGSQALCVHPSTLPSA